MQRPTALAIQSTPERYRPPPRPVDVLPCRDLHRSWYRASGVRGGVGGKRMALVEMATRLFPQDRPVERTFEIEYADKIDAQSAP
jgi:hypothetical protein